MLFKIIPVRLDLPKGTSVPLLITAQRQIAERLPEKISPFLTSVPIRTIVRQGTIQGPDRWFTITDIHDSTPLFFPLYYINLLINLMWKGLIHTFDQKTLAEKKISPTVASYLLSKTVDGLLDLTLVDQDSIDKIRKALGLQDDDPFITALRTYEHQSKGANPLSADFVLDTYFRQNPTKVLKINGWVNSQDSNQIYLRFPDECLCAKHEQRINAITLNPTADSHIWTKNTGFDITQIITPALEARVRVNRVTQPFYALPPHNTILLDDSGGKCDSAKFSHAYLRKHALGAFGCPIIPYLITQANVMAILQPKPTYIDFPTFYSLAHILADVIPSEFITFLNSLSPKLIQAILNITDVNRRSLAYTFANARPSDFLKFLDALLTTAPKITAAILAIEDAAMDNQGPRALVALHLYRYIGDVA